MAPAASAIRQRRATATTLGSTNYDTKLDTVTSRLEYPISQSRRLFTEWQASGQRRWELRDEHQPEDLLRLSAALGIEFSLNKLRQLADGCAPYPGHRCEQRRAQL